MSTSVRAKQPRILPRLLRAMFAEYGKARSLIRMIGALALQLVATAAGLALMRIVGMLSQFAVERSAGEAGRWLLISAGVWAVSFGAGALHGWVIGVFQQNLLLALRNRTVQSLARSAYGWIETQKPGDLIERAGADTNQANEYVATYLMDLIGIGFRALLSVVMIFFLHPLVSAVYLALLPVVALIQKSSSKPVERYTQQARDARGKATACAMDALTNLTTVRAYGLERQMCEQYARRQSEHLRRLIKSWVRTALFWIPGSLLSVVPILVMCVLGGYFVLGGSMNVGALVTMILACEPLSEISWKLIDRIVTFRESAAGARRVFEIWDAPQEKSDIGLPVGDEVGDGECEDAVRFEDVSFSYDGQRDVLRGVSFALKKGEKLALVGRSGCGKSTVMKLAAALYRADRGRVSVFGRDAAYAAPAALREKMAYITQDTYLFPESLRENISLSQPDAGDEQIVGVCRMAGLDFVGAWPQGLNTLAGERGAQISGGQRQRVAIARALLRQAPLVLLDEATSSLDTLSERQIQAELAQLLVGRSALIVAHRLSSIRNADRILVLDEGRIAEEGTHDSLMARRGLYAALYATQQNGGDDA